MNFAFVINNNYVNQMIVTATSICINNAGNHNFYIFTSDISASNMAKINDQLGKYKCKSIIITVDDRCLDGVPILRNDFNKTPYYKLLIPIYLPLDVERILYLDADMIVDKSITEMYNLDLDEYYFAAVPDIIRNEKDKEYLKKLGINYEKGERYFNSGLILFNMERFRKYYKIEDALEYIQKNGATFKYHDQEVLNGLFFKNYFQLDEKYNRFTGFHSVVEILVHILKIDRSEFKNTVVFHYANLKPWNDDYIGKWENVYWKYAKQSTAYSDLQVNYRNNLNSQLNALVKRLRRKFLK